jgi:hypothetical protein
VLSEFPVKYVVGSGRHSLTYLVEADGFLVESPVSWYASRKAWGMSPGYDNPHHGGFERAVGEGCLVCHAGQAQAVDRSLHRMQVGEAAIGCERCHGPGSLHVARHGGLGRPSDAPAEAIDDTIVNPAHLPRALAEAVCQQCHLRTAATVPARGRQLADYRPGLPLEDFRQDYQLEQADKPMTVVGHVEQMHLSICYQKSATLTCLSCHNPHREPRLEARDAHYNAVCATCHAPERCTVDPTRRTRESPANSCIHCHMPSAPTEIPHLAFTHHRIGVHGGRAAAPPELAWGPAAPAVLRSFLDLSRLSDLDRKRSLGLGYLEVANRKRDGAATGKYRTKALALLSGVRAAGLHDPAVDAALARLHFDLELGEAALYASGALAHPDLAGQDRCNALFLAADAHARQGRHREAITLLVELTRLRRHPVDWLLLADCRQALGDPTAVEALAQAVRINPRLWRVHERLADHYRRQGDAGKAEWHQQRAVP